MKVVFVGMILISAILVGFGERTFAGEYCLASYDPGSKGNSTEFNVRCSKTENGFSLSPDFYVCLTRKCQETEYLSALKKLNTEMSKLGYEEVEVVSYGLSFHRGHIFQKRTNPDFAKANKSCLAAQLGQGAQAYCIVCDDYSVTSMVRFNSHTLNDYMTSIGYKFKSRLYKTIQRTQVEEFWYTK